MTANIITSLDDALALQNGCACNDDPALPDQRCMRCRTDHDTIAASLVHHMQRADSAEEQARRDHMLACEMDQRGRTAEERALALEAELGAMRERVASLTLAVQEFAPECHHCARVRTQVWPIDSARKRGLCDVCARSYSPCEDAPHANVLRSLGDRSLLRGFCPINPAPKGDPTP